MHFSNLFKIITVSVTALVFSGCALTMPKTTIDQNAFGAKKKYALVSISGINSIQSNRPNAVGIGGLIRSISKSSGMSSDSKSVLNDATPKFYDALVDAKGFDLVSEKKVVRNKVYKKIGSDEKKVFLSTIITPKSYKVFSEKNDAKKLSKALGVDGIISVNATYTFSFSGLDLFGLVAIGKHRANVLLSINGTDKNGNVVWQDFVKSTSDEGLWSSTASVANFDKLHPLFIQVSQKAMQKAVRKLDAKLPTQG